MIRFVQRCTRNARPPNVHIRGLAVLRQLAPISSEADFATKEHLKLTLLTRDVRVTLDVLSNNVQQRSNEQMALGTTSFRCHC